MNDNLDISSVAEAEADKTSVLEPERWRVLEKKTVRVSFLFDSVHVCELDVDRLLVNVVGN